MSFQEVIEIIKAFFAAIAQIFGALNIFGGEQPTEPSDEA